MENAYAVEAFYKFFELESGKLETFKQDLESCADQHALSGLVILAEEGCNGTIAGSQDGIEALRNRLFAAGGSSDWNLKQSFSSEDPFRDFRIKVRSEIVTSGTPETSLPEGLNYLSPKEWHDILSKEEDVLLLDTRNYYESELGIFRGSVVPNLIDFQQFPDFVRKLDVDKKKKVLMYCTGGIRCEKASGEMREQGFENVFQLHGGILAYLKEYPDSLFDGECFVFDQRVAVDQGLSPSKRYVFCPHCGQPGEQKVTCNNCSKEATVCQRCEQVRWRQSCSKNCSYHLRRKIAASDQSE